MADKLRSRVRASHLIALATGIVIGLVSLGSAYAITSSRFRYSTPQTGYLSVHPADLAPDRIGDPQKDYFNSWSQGLRNEEASNRCFNTGINLPKGAKIRSVTFYYKSDGTSDFFGHLFRVRLGETDYDPLAEVSPDDDSDVVTSVTASVPGVKQKVKNKGFAYALGVCMDAEPGATIIGTYFNGARIKYTYRSAGD